MSLENLIMQVKSSQELLINAKTAAADLLKEMMKDESIPLWDRWNLYMEFGRHCLKVDDDICFIPTCVSDYCRESCYTERYQTAMFCDKFDETYMTKERRNTAPERIEQVQANFKTIPEKVVRGVLNTGLAGFVYDW